MTAETKTTELTFESGPGDWQLDPRLLNLGGHILARRRAHARIEREFYFKLDWICWSWHDDVLHPTDGEGAAFSDHQIKTATCVACLVTADRWMAEGAQVLDSDGLERRRALWPGSAIGPHWPFWDDHDEGPSGS